MKKYILIFIIIFLNNSSLYGSSLIYETNSYKIDINDEFIDDGKKREIEIIKILSLYDILNNILIEEDLNRLKKIINFDVEVNFLIKNIIIENEFIGEKKYSADVKINFEINEIINLLRNNNINYIDNFSPNHLLIVAETSDLLNEGLSFNNSFYKKKINQLGLINLIVPKLSTNDRFLLSYDKIIKKDLNAINKLASKYNTEKAFIILLNDHKNKVILDISILDSLNSINNIDTVTFNNNEDLGNNLYTYLNYWWKKNNLIENSLIQSKSCLIKNSNLYEVTFINSKLNIISQVKSNSLKQISLGYNINEIMFFGKLSNLILKLSKYNIYLTVDDKKNCIISTIK